MKILVSVLAIALTFALTTKALASEEAHGGGHEDHEALAKKMNSLFPEKKANPEDAKIPAKPELTSPAYFAAITTPSVKLEWKAAADAQEYHVQVATDPNFKWIVAEDYAHKETNYEVTKLEPGKHYFWRVASVRPDNWKTFRKSYFAASMFETPAAK